MSELLKPKIRGINKHTHPAEIGQFLIDNADRIQQAVVLVDYEGEDGKIHTNERYVGEWTTQDLAWWVACLQSTLYRQM